MEDQYLNDLSIELRQIIQLLKEHAYYLLEQETIPSFTTHNASHSERIIRNLSALIKNRIKLSEHEAFVLLGAAYLHDVSIASPEKVLPIDQIKRGYYEFELRKNHGEYSANYIRNRLLPKIIKDNSNVAMIIRENSDLFEGIAVICQYHTAETKILDECIPPSQRLHRLSVLAYFFIIADELDAGKDRVRVQEVLNSTIDFKSKEFWLLHSTISGYEIKRNRITIYSLKPDGISKDRFRRLTIRPLINHIEAIVKRANDIFNKFEIKSLSVGFRIDSLPLSVNVETITELDNKYIFDRKVHQRLSKWQKLLDSRTIEKGVIERKLIGDEFHIFRRWGSSTHRLFSNRMGLQKGGGYFLSWDGFGLVIDPGYDFLSNVFSMINYPFTIKDFHGVFISHSHDDHTHDLEPIISLEYRLRREEEISSNSFEYDFPVLCSEGARWKYSPITASNQFVKLVPIIPTKNSRREPDRLPKRNYLIPILSLHDLMIESILSYHGEQPWHLNNTGLVSKIYCGKENNFCIGYTSDTSFEWEIVEFLKDTDFVVIHIGNKMAPNNDPYPRHHLGEGGCIDLISNLKFHRPRLFILNEFGADEFISGNSDDRINFTRRVESLSGALNLHKRVLPGDVGLRVKLPDLKIWCEENPRRYRPTSDNPNGQWTPPSNVNLLLLPGHEIHYIS